MYYTGKVPGGLSVHANKEQLIYPVGCAVVLEGIAGKKKQQLLVGDNNTVSCVATSKSGRFVASGTIITQDLKVEIVLWDAKELKEKFRFKLHKVEVRALAFSPNDKYLVSLGGQDDPSVVVWDLETGAAFCGGAVSAGGSALCIGNDVKFFNNKDTSFVTAGNATIRVWDIDVATHKLKPVDVILGSLRRDTNCLVISPDDENAYLGTKTGDVLTINLRNRIFKAVSPEKGRCENGVTALAIVRTGQLLVASGAGVVIKVNPTTWKTESQTAKPLFGAVTSLALRGDGHEIYAGTSCSQIYRINFSDFNTELRSVSHYGPISQVCFPTKISDLFATCATDGIRVWDTTLNKELLRISVPNKTCMCVVFSPDGKLIVSGWDDSAIRAFTPQTGKLVFEIFDAHQDGATALAFAHNGQRLVSGGGAGLVRVWKLGADKQTLECGMKEHKGRINEIRMKKNDTECVSASADGSVIIWDLKRFVRNQILFANTIFRQTCYRPDEAQVLTVGSDRKVGYWEVFDGSLIREFDVSVAGCVTSLDIAADGNTFATAGEDRLVKLYGYGSGICNFVGSNHSGNISHLRICPNQRFIVCVTTDGAIFRWAYPPGK